jgi:hypothetical protein
LQHVPAITAANPGKRLDFTRHGVPAGTAAPFSGAFGADLSRAAPYEGTLFRLPLRTAEQAAESSISRQVYDPRKVAAMLEALRAEAHLVLLFLKSVRRIDVLEWREGEAAPTPLFSCQAVPPSAAPALLQDTASAAAAAAAASSGGGEGGGVLAAQQGSGDGAAEWGRLARERALFLHAAVAPEAEQVASTYGVALITR